MLQWIQEALKMALSGQNYPGVHIERRGRNNSAGLTRNAATQAASGIELLSYADGAGLTVEYFMVGQSTIDGPDPIAGTAVALLSPGAYTDDGYEINTGTIVGWSDGTALNARYSTSSCRWVYVRFPSCKVPQGTTIGLAELTGYIVSSVDDDPNVTVYGNDTDDAPTLTGASSQISSMTRTTASVAWSGSALGVGYATVEITSVMQEIVDRAGYAAGNDVGIIMQVNLGSAVQWAAWGGTPNYPFQLQIIY